MPIYIILFHELLCDIFKDLKVFVFILKDFFKRFPQCSHFLYGIFSSILNKPNYIGQHPSQS